VCERQRDREKIIITIPRIKNTFTPTFTQIRGDNTPIIAVFKKGGLFHLYKISSSLMTTHYTKDKKIKELSRFLYVYF
jgi:hypothetical protein